MTSTRRARGDLLFWSKRAGQKDLVKKSCSKRGGQKDLVKKSWSIWAMCTHVVQEQLVFFFLCRISFRYWYIILCYMLPNDLNMWISMHVHMHEESCSVKCCTLSVYWNIHNCMYTCMYVYMHAHCLCHLEYVYMRVYIYVNICTDVLIFWGFFLANICHTADST
jgi:hypothetical protein